MLIAAILISAVISYLIGSLNSALTVVKLWKHEDIREHGSKNAGLTNALRVYGKGVALVTLIADLAKGVIAVLLSKLVFSLLLTGILPEELYFVGYLAGFFAVLGHIFPLYFGFKGGKGILIAATTLLVTDPIVFCIVIPMFAILVAATKYVSLSSIITAAAYPIVTFTVEYLRDIPFRTVCIDTGIVIGISFFLIFMHRPNIKRLLAGTESKFSFKSSKREEK